MNLNKVGLHNEDIIHKNYILLAIVYGAFVILFRDFLAINLLFIIFQIVYFFALIINKEYVKYLSIYIIFSSLSLEFEYLHGAFYGLKTIRLLGISASIWLILPLFIVSLVNVAFSVRKKYKYKEILYIISALNITALIMGIVTVSLNDNSVQSIYNYRYEFLKTTYEYFSRLILPSVVLLFCLNRDKNNLLVKALVSVMIGVTFQEILSFGLGIHGKIWSADVLMVGPIQTFAPFSILFALFFRDTFAKFCFLILGIIAFFFSIKYSFGSIQFIILFSLPFWVMFTLRGKYGNSIIKKIFSVSLVIIILCLMFLDFFSYEDSIKYKLNQAVDFLAFWNSNWLDTLGESARFRVEEFIAIISEYISKPYFLIFGKGFMGTVVDHNNYFYSNSQAWSINAYSYEEWYNGVFYSLHESFNKIFLINGLFGLYLFIYLVFKGLKNLNKSPFLTLGIIWLFFYWGFSTVYSFFGLASLYLGFQAIEDFKYQKNERIMQNAKY